MTLLCIYTTMDSMWRNTRMEICRPCTKNVCVKDKERCKLNLQGEQNTTANGSKWPAEKLDNLRKVGLCNGQEFGKTIHIRMQGLRYDILRYCKKGNIL